MTMPRNATPLLRSSLMMMRIILIGLQLFSANADQTVTESPSFATSTSAPTETPTLVPTTVGPSLAPTTSFTTTIPTTSSPTTVPTGISSTSGPTGVEETMEPTVADEPTATPVTTGPTATPSAATDTPTLVPTMVPTNLPSLVPSYVPSSTPSSSAPTGASFTTAPSLIPSNSPAPVVASESPSATIVLLEGTFTTTNVAVNALMNDLILAEYEMVAFGYLSQQLMSTGITLLNLTITDQALVTGSRMLMRRGLQTNETLYPLNVDMMVAAESPSAETNLGELCSMIFEQTGTSVFLPLLKSGEFADYFASVESVTSAAAGPPTPAPSSGGGLSTGAIIGIAVAGAVVVIAAGGYVFLRSRRNLSDDGSWGPPRDTDTAASRQNRFFGVASSDSGGRGSKNNRTSSNTAPAIQRVESEELSYLQSDINSQLGADTLMGADSMSYAYSLDHGFDGQSQAPSDMSPTNYGGGVPEITASNSGDNFEVGYAAAAAATSEITRECYAPPGKLGIVIDTTLKGPVVHTVNAGSPLEGVVWPGDRIVAIDDVDCQTMSATAITDLMVKTVDKRRKLTIVSDAS